MVMDPLLEKAAKEGDVEFLKQAVAVQQQPPEYFLARDFIGRSIFHLAAEYEEVEFMNEAMKILPTNIIKQLLLITENHLWTPLHTAASYGKIRFIKCVVEMYASLWWDTDDVDHVNPWLALTKFNQTPFNLLLVGPYANDEYAMEIMMIMDTELESCTIADRSGKTPLYNAVKEGYNRVAEKILKSTQPATSILGETDLLSLLSLVDITCTGNVVRLLWEKCDGGLSNDGNTPLHSALHSTSTQEVALQTLSTYPAMRHIRNSRGESPFFLAVKAGYKQVVDAIMKFEEPRYLMLRRNDGTTVLHILSSCPEKTSQMLLEKYWWLNNLRDYQGKTALDYAKQEKTHWLVNLLTNPSLIKKQDFDWVEACKREEMDAVLAFVDNCEDLQRACRKENDTPLHHVKLATYKDYVNFLKIRSVAELKNTTDHDGATPLHRALERKDMYFAKALLLDDEVQQTITDYNGRTPMHLLAKLCMDNDEWDKMCKLIKVNPNLKTSYVKAGTNLDQIRNTLSVIAALLATITFAAGFTLPGGINSNNGEALLAKKASFLVFLLADVYAMCTSMLVLFCLVWSMVSEPDIARVLVDRSVIILMQSLYGTLLAFMTGIYTVIEHNSLWAAIVVFVMCSFIGISANRTILHKVIALLVPAANTRQRDRTRLLEEGNAGASTVEKYSFGRREAGKTNGSGRAEAGRLGVGGGTGPRAGWRTKKEGPEGGLGSGWALGGSCLVRGVRNRPGVGGGSGWTCDGAGGSGRSFSLTNPTGKRI
ncbi:hypothetical protein KSS87_001955 [Heliosperma pusillum]|nr:hypothetical protein KSS87_001955 [Heliosperma pusillum]